MEMNMYMYVWNMYGCGSKMHLCHACDIAVTKAAMERQENCQFVEHNQQQPKTLSICSQTDSKAADQPTNKTAQNHKTLDSQY